VVGSIILIKRPVESILAHLAVPNTIILPTSQLIAESSITSTSPMAMVIVGMVSTVPGSATNRSSLTAPSSAAMSVRRLAGDRLRFPEV